MSYRVAENVKFGRNVEMGDNVTIEDSVIVGNNVSVGDNVIIRKGAIIEDNVIIGYKNIMPEWASPAEYAATEIGENARIRSGGVIYWGTKIGRNSTIGHHTGIRQNTIIGHDTYIDSLVGLGGNTIVGDYVGIQSLSVIVNFSNIGDYTFIGPSFVSTNDRKMAYRRTGHGQDLVGFTTEKYVRIAAGVTVLPGIHFGEGCIVGAGSVVTKDIPPYKFAIGVPARVIEDAPREEITR